jgi:hypothetical protein
MFDERMHAQSIAMSDASSKANQHKEIAMAFNETFVFEEIQVLREAEALVQHHDGVTGVLAIMLLRRIELHVC